jgi:hypothetical protein
MLFGLSGYAQVGKDLAKPPEPKKQESLKTETGEKDTIPVNAYYLAKDLYSFLKTHKPETPQKDSISARKILSKLCYYLGTDEPDDIRKKMKESSKMKDLLTDLQTSAEYISDSMKVYKILTSTEIINKEISDLKAQNSSNQEFWKIINQFKTKIDYLSTTIGNGPVMIQKDSLDTTRLSERKYHYQKLVTVIKNYDSLKVDYNYLSYLNDSIEKSKKDIDSKSLAEFNKLSSADKQKLVKTINWSSIESFIAEFGNRINAIQQQDAQITISLLESSSGSISGFKMPTEAEMIDAVATYIASRVKQETVLWFFDQMRNNTERYELIMTAFPETMKLIQSSEVFDAPNMGSAWKYALSKDFIHLPKNILSSEWIKERIPHEQEKYLDLACISWEISELVDSRLSYRDMIKQLYLKRNLDEELHNFPDTIISFLYGVSNELYIINNQSVRNLTYEEISSMPFGQLEIMLELLNMKYANSINNLFLNRGVTRITKEDKKQIAKWIGNSLLALSQFDKILQQIEQNKKEKNGKETALFDGYNTWKLISQLVESAIPAKKMEIYKPYIRRADDAFEIYHLLSEKNYAGAVSKTLELVDSLIYSEYLQIDPDHSKKNAPFLLTTSKVKQVTLYSYKISALGIPSRLGSSTNPLIGILNVTDTLEISFKTKKTIDKLHNLILPAKFLKKAFKKSFKEKYKTNRKLINSLFKTYLKAQKKANSALNNQTITVSIPTSIRRSIESPRYQINISDLDEEFVKKHIKPKKFPRIARHLKKSSIFILPKDIVPINTAKQKLFSVEQSVIKEALTDNECFLRKCRVKYLFKKFNRTEIDAIIENLYDWSGEKVNDSLIRFPINSIAAQALISSDKKAMQMIMKLASFLNDVSLSNNEKELKKVIESYALPPGSYKQKRNAWHSLTLNAFAGPYTGYETIGFMNASKKFHPDSAAIISYGSTYGISAPIGITYTKTFGKRIFNTSRLPGASQENPDIIKIKRNNLYMRTNWSLSVSLTFVDIGAIVSYRMSNTDKVLDQSFKWEQFISPGINFGISIPKTPLMIQMGYQYTPKIRRLDKDGFADKQIGMWRTYAGVFFDIPLVNLWMKTRSVKYE